MKILVSVRSVDEALQASGGGADFIDLKEPRAGALGGLPIATIRDIVAALRRPGRTALPISATIGDLPTSDAERIVERADAVGRCGVDYVKVGIGRDAAAAAVLDALAALHWPVVPVFIADHGLEPAHVERACALGFAGVMADTADKRTISLFDAVPLPALRRFVATVRENGAIVGLAGALRVTHLPVLRELAPDFAGFRSAVCSADRGSALDPARLADLVARLRSTTSDSAESTIAR